jgi:hypothetical protein
LLHVWWTHQCWRKLRKSALLQVVICRLDASCFINLHQVCRYQVLTSLMEQLGPSLMNASMLMQVARIRLAASCYPQACCKLLSAGLLQVVICRLAASCSGNLQQACG